MSTAAQIKANRQNAQKSTGPKTAEGKAAVSRNAVKHGLFTESVVTGEKPADYAAFHDNMLADLAPVGAVETTLAERVISLWRRLRRAERMQNEVIEDMIEDQVTNPDAVSRREDHCYNEGLEPGDPRFEPEHLALGRVVSSDWSCTRVLDRMLLDERRIESSLNRAMRELKRHQTIRRFELQEARKQQSAHNQAIPKALDFEAATHFATPSLGDEAATRFTSAENDGDLKEQSQFAADESAASLYAEDGYDDNVDGEAGENKAKRSQLRTHCGLNGSDRREVDPAFRAS